MHRLVRTSLLTAGVAALLAWPGGAYAASAEQIIRDCSQDGDFDREYSQRDLREAEGRLPTDIDEYTDCRDVINQAQIRDRSSRGGEGGGGAGGGGGGSGSGTGGALTPSPEDAKALAGKAKRADEGDAPSLSVGGERIDAGGGVLRTGSAAHELPLPILLALICVAAVSAVGGYAVLRRRYPEAGRAALRLFRR
jgi:hypothetical protein